MINSPAGFTIYKKPYFVLLLLATVLLVGFVNDLDFTQRFGCLIFPEDHLQPYRYFFLGFSLVLLVAIAAVPSKRLAISLLATEITFSLLIFLFFKGGYAVGYSGGPSEAMLIFDSTLFFLRALLVFRMLGRDHRIWFQLVTAFLLSVCLVILKMQKLTMPVFDL